MSAVYCYSIKCCRFNSAVCALMTIRPQQKQLLSWKKHSLLKCSPPQPKHGFGFTKSFLIFHWTLGRMYSWKVLCFDSNVIMFQVYNSLTFFSDFLKHYMKVLVVLGWIISLCVEPGIEPVTFRFQCLLHHFPLCVPPPLSSFSLSRSPFFSLSVLLPSFFFHLLSCFCFSPRKSRLRKSL